MSETASCKATTAAGHRCTRKGRYDGLCGQHAQGGERQGPKNLLTPETHHNLVTSLRAGSTVQDACAVAGIGISTYYSWIERGEADAEAGKQTPELELAEAATHARAAARVRAVGHVRSAMEEDWRAAAWFLERSDPENWGRRERIDQRISGGGVPVHLEVSGADLVENAEARERAAELRRIVGDARQEQPGGPGTSN